MISEDKKAKIRSQPSAELREFIATQQYGGENAAFAEMVLQERELEAAAGHEKITADAAVKSADAAVRSAAASEASARYARWALFVSVLALAVAFAALFRG